MKCSPLPLLLGLLGLLAMLVACAPTRSVFPPAASVQALNVQPDGRWQVTVRLDNYAYRSMRFVALDVRLRIGGADAGALSGPLDLRIPELNGDVAVFTLTPTPEARTALTGDREGNIAYALTGSVRAGPEMDDLTTYPLQHTGYLSPVPGLPDAWR